MESNPLFYGRYYFLSVSYTHLDVYKRQTIENVIRWFDYWRERPGTGDRVNSGGVKRCV